MAGATGGIDLTMGEDIKEIETHEAAILAKKVLLAGKIPPGCAVMADRKENTVVISDGGKLRVFTLIVLNEIPGGAA